MKIHYALHSCDSNPFYLDFWPVVSKAWLKIGITPVLIKLSDTFTFNVNEDKAIEYTLPFVEGMNAPFQALNARIWGYKMLTGNCIISDIDMMPLSKKYFDSISEPYLENQIISSASDAIEKFGQIASCYFVGSNKLISTLIEEDTWQEFITKRAAETGQVWGSDQWYLEQLIAKHDDVVHLTRGFNDSGIADKRIDRVNWSYNSEDVMHGAYYDAHLLRPYSQYKKEIDQLYSLL